MLTGMSVLHVVAPQPFDRIVPRVLPGSPRTWTYLSGAAELTCAALLANPRTRKVGGYATAATFVAVFPANIQAAIDERPPEPLGIAMWLRLPLQIPLIRWALRVARG